MHRMYEFIWRCAEHIGGKCLFSKKTWFLAFSIGIWLLIGLVVAVIAITLTNRVESGLDTVVWEIVVGGYISVIMGLGGGIMYLLRNTNPEDIK